MNKKIYDVVIIDSGVENCSNEEGIYFLSNGLEFVQNSKLFTDNVGHGTAIYTIIKSHNSNAQCFHIKVFNKENDSINEDVLIYVLNYIYKKLT